MGIPRSKNARLFYRAAKQRFEDARLLLEWRRTTAAVYLAGYSVECILKALLLSISPGARQRKVLETFRGGRAHDYGWLLGLYAERGGTGMPPHLSRYFARATTWSTRIRYDPGTMKIRDAKAFLDSAREILNWVEGRLS